MADDYNALFSETEYIDALEKLRNDAINAVKGFEVSSANYDSQYNFCEEQRKNIASKYPDDMDFGNCTDLQVCVQGDSTSKSLEEQGYHRVYYEPCNLLKANKSTLPDIDIDNPLSVAKQLNGFSTPLTDSVKQTVMNSYEEKKAPYLRAKTRYEESCKHLDERGVKLQDSTNERDAAVESLTNAFNEYKEHLKEIFELSDTLPEYVDYLLHINGDEYTWVDFARKYKEQLKDFTFTYRNGTTHGVLDTLAETGRGPSWNQLYALKRLRADILNGTVKRKEAKATSTSKAKPKQTSSTSKAEPKQTSFEKHPDWIVLGDMELYLCKSVTVHNDVLDTKISRTVSYQGNMSEKQARYVTDYLGEIVNEIFKTIDSSTEYETENKNGLLAVKGVCDETQFDSWFKNYLDTNFDWVSKLNANADIADKLDISKFSQLVNQN